MPLWEEPHPGRRMLYPSHPSGQERDDSDAECCGEGGGSAAGMARTARSDGRAHYAAAEGRTGPRPDEPEPAPMVIERAPRAPAPAIVSPDTDSGISGSILSQPPTANSGPERPDVMMGDDACDDFGSPSPSLLLPISPMSEFEDLSNYLDSPQDHDKLPIAHVADPAAYNRLELNDDLYGWDAMLDQSIPAPASPGIMEPYLLQEGSGSARYGGPPLPHMPRPRLARRPGLLKRVFSVGKAPPPPTGAPRRSRFLS